MFYIHKHETALTYAGPEEGGWYYDHKTPVEGWIPLSMNDEDAAYEMCRLFNEQEYTRREGLQYGYTSVLSYREEFFTFSVTESSVPEQPVRPHYE